ncbi:MAG: DUF5681 domain-containing protein [Methylocystis sp.]|uniref:DUF5681 domain-containing protein n=1 Tax=Methylocystis sp. TaxID=1911079 RepID=UPI003DA651F0
MGKWRGPSQPPDYEVGYGRPPKGTRFRPGQSGNPKGRPRRQRTIGASLQRALSRRVRVQENGVTKKVSVKDIIASQLTNKAAKGDLRVTKLLFDLTDGYQGSTEEAAIAGG